ncbi:hypothetical protein A2392_00790 [Candidatus Kaiserbacteria bacterium RIFOXYB1_FULL_46_14]|uniref:Uncharacterized protein n=1 Tax=Candidatus Kaiserbacteria bacterium RIFOXYB1_FULL_46_14 TaxID=1798531 RepID=A0A1F6FJG6_9BACT|nr:MAG: hypothetical protein A2392_00790 [Candidatus Kaiserbacteria bacterium RIFOXYB1_FULL_46_14]
MGEVINMKFASPQTREKNGDEKSSPPKALLVMSDFIRHNQKSLFWKILVVLGVMMIVSLLWADNILYGLLIFVVVGIISTTTAVLLVLWAEKYSPDWDHQ